MRASANSPACLVLDVRLPGLSGLDLQRELLRRKTPIPIIFIRDRGINKKTFEPIREVIDGQQRLRTIISFISSELLEDYNATIDDFTVKKTHNKDLAGVKYVDLADEFQDRILNYEFNPR